MRLRRGALVRCPTSLTRLRAVQRSTRRITTPCSATEVAAPLEIAHLFAKICPTLTTWRPALEVSAMTSTSQPTRQQASPHWRMPCPITTSALPTKFAFRPFKRGLPRQKCVKKVTLIASYANRQPTTHCLLSPTASAGLRVSVARLAAQAGTRLISTQARRAPIQLPKSSLNLTLSSTMSTRST